MSGDGTEKQRRQLPQGLRLPVAAALAVLCTCTLPFVLRFQHSVVFTNSVLAAPVLVAFFLLFRYLLDALRPAAVKIAWPLGLVFSTLAVLGAQTLAGDRVDLRQPGMYVAILAWSCFFGGLAALGFGWLEQPIKAPTRLGARIRGTALWRRLAVLDASPKSWLLCLAVLLVCWGFAFLVAFPGFFSYDATDEYNRFVYNDMSTHHPPLHIFLLAGSVDFFHKLTGSYNAGVAVYVGGQMLFTALCFTYALVLLRRLGVPGWLRLLSLGFFSLFPTVVMFVLCTTKDSLFSALVFLFFLQLMLIQRDARAFFASPLRTAGLVVVTALMLLLRNNALYALMVLLPFVLLTGAGRRLRTWLCLGLAMALFWLVDGPLYGSLGIRRGEVKEMLSVPMQQLARTYNERPEAFSEADSEILFRYLNEKRIGAYAPKLSDQIKYRFNNDAFVEDPGSFFSLWWRIGVKNPGVYINATLYNTVDAWYPDSVVNGYNFEGYWFDAYSVGGTSYFLDAAEEPANRASFFPTLYPPIERFARQLSFQNIPMASMLFSIGFQFWVLLFTMAYLLYRRLHRLLFPFLYVLLLFLTILLGPIMLVRYALYLFYLFPLTLAVLARPRAFAPPKPKEVSGIG